MPGYLGMTRRAYLDVAQRTTEDAQVGGLLLVHVRNVLLQRLKALLQVSTSGGGGVTFNDRLYWDGASGHGGRSLNKPGQLPYDL